MRNQNIYCGVEFKNESFVQRVLTAFLIGVFLFVVYTLLSEAAFIPSFSNVLTIPAVFMLGLLASISSCMATSGTVFLSAISRTKSNKITSSFLFNAGRILTYTAMGFVLGYLGKSIAIDLKSSLYLTVGVSIAMVFVGLDMLKILPLSRIVPSGVSRFFWRKIDHHLFERSHKTMFVLGIFTYWLPCGFTQTVQLYALGIANPWQSAIIMGVFAIGTAPALLMIGITSSFTKTRWYPWFLKTIGVVIVLVSFGYLINTVQLYSGTFVIGRSSSYKETVGEVRVENGYQLVEMSVLQSGYEPNTFTIKKDMPVKWIVKGINVYGCQGFLNVPKLGIQKALELGINIFEFTPKKSETIAFSCSSNSVQGVFRVI